MRYNFDVQGTEPSGLRETASKLFVLFFEKIIVSSLVQDDSKGDLSGVGGLALHLDTSGSL